MQLPVNVGKEGAIVCLGSKDVRLRIISILGKVSGELYALWFWTLCFYATATPDIGL